MNIQNKKIGIWGFGVVGKAALAYFENQGIATIVMDAKRLTPEERSLIEKSKSSCIDQKNCLQFLETNDYILASPGIDLRPYEKYKHKFITELDIFGECFKKPIIAITGTIGKTSITHLLSAILQTQKKIATGGNIGTGMLSLIGQQDEVDYAILELSSFQLESCSSFAPDLAIWTNFFPNHLDRHGSLEHYFKAKCRMLVHQKKHQQALVPLDLMPLITNNLIHIEQQFHFFSDTKPTQEQRQAFPHSHYFWLNNTSIMHQLTNQISSLLDINKLPSITFAQNWLIIAAALTVRTIPLTILEKLPTLNLPSHRIEKVATINSIDFYNDSKATVPEATLAAVRKLQGNPIILFMGGISKGVDRTFMFKELKQFVSTIFFFGSEARFLADHACSEHISSFAFLSLEEAFKAAIEVAQPGEQLLFSPSGASYDLFAHYEERGNCFKKLVEEYRNSHNQS